MKAAVLIKRHQQLIADGFLPIEVEVLEGPNKIQCWVCKYPNLQDPIRWKNEKTGEICHTGLTCFERVVNQITLNEIDKATLLWAATHHEILKGKGALGLEETRIIRTMSYKNPVARVYGGDWKKVAKLLWIDYSAANVFERSFLKTLVYERGKYWVPSSPTPKQRRILNEIFLKFLKWKYPDLA